MKKCIDENDMEGITDPLGEHNESGKGLTTGQFEMTSQIEDKTHELLPILIMMNRQWKNCFFMLVSLAMVLATALLRGGEGARSIIGIDKCSSLSMMIFILSQAIAGYISYKAYKYNRAQLDEDDHHESDTIDCKTILLSEKTLYILQAKLHYRCRCRVTWYRWRYDSGSLYACSWHGCTNVYISLWLYSSFHFIIY